MLTLKYSLLFYSLTFWFFGHNSAPRQFWGAPPGGNESYRPPGPFWTKIFEIKPRENQDLEVNIFEITRNILTTIKSLAMYTVFYKEFESEVKKFQILEPGGKK